MCRVERISSRLSRTVDDHSLRTSQLVNCWERSFASVASNGPSTSIQLSCCPTICTPSGHFLVETRSIQSDGLGLSVNSQSDGWQREGRKLRSVTDDSETVDAACGSRSSGNTRLKMRATWNVTSITSITILSNTVTSVAQSTGRGQASVSGSITGRTPATGDAPTAIHSHSKILSKASASECTPMRPVKPALRN